MFYKRDQVRGSNKYTLRMKHRITRNFIFATAPQRSTLGLLKVPKQNVHRDLAHPGKKDNVLSFKLTAVLMKVNKKKK